MTSEGREQLVWFITGTSSGLGRHLVQTALSRGDYVIATARSLAKIQDFPASDKLRTVQLDVTEGFTSIKAKIDEAVTYFGRIDVLVNNAGYGHKSLLEEGGSDVLRQQFDTNFFGLVDVTNAALPHMRARRSGTIVLIGSRASWAPEIPGSGPYVASKAAVRVFGETLSTELTPLGLRTLIVEPGGFVTNSMGGPWHDANPIPDYTATREGTKRALAGAGARFRGDPAKAMALLADVVRGEGRAEGRPWPLYLPLGELAEAAIRGKAQRMLGVLEEWKDVTSDLNFDGK